MSDITTPIGNRITIRSQAREIIARVIEKTIQEKKQLHAAIPFAKAIERAADYTGVGISTVKRIRKEDMKRKETNPEGRLITPGKKRKKCDERINGMRLDSHDQCVIRNAILDSYIAEKRVPSVEKLFMKIKEKILFPWTSTSFWKFVKGLGFKWKTFSPGRKILLERQSLIDSRSKFLTQMKKFREDNRHIVYIGEIWVDKALNFHKWWWMLADNEHHATLCSKDRLIIIHAGGVDGFICDAKLMFQTGSTFGDFQGQLNSKNFAKWVVEILIPLLPNNSIVVLDNAPHHCSQNDAVPSRYSTKAEMVSWLRTKGVDCNENMRKTCLYQFVKAQESPNDNYEVDRLFSIYGHTVVRLPPHMQELNPMEMAWNKVKQLTAENVDLPVEESVLEIVNAAIENVTGENWKEFYCHVQRLEEEYWDKDEAVEDIIDGIIRNSKTEVHVSDSSSSDSSEAEDAFDLISDSD